MSMLKHLAAGAAIIALTATASAQAPKFGQPIAPADVAPWDISIGPDGAGLPPGRGTAAQGEAIYAVKCQACHGEKGAGRPNDALVGGKGSLEAGKQADLIAIDLSQAHNTPVHDPIAAIIFSATAADILFTAVAGRVLFNRDLKTLDEAELLRRVNAAQLRMG